MPPEALIFDVDGTLAETEELHRQAFNESFAEAGLPWHWSMQDYRRLLQTTGGKERIARHMRETGHKGEIDIPALHAAKTARYTTLMATGTLPLRPGVGDLIADARARGITLAIATTTSRPNVDALCLACFGAPTEAIFAVTACGDEVPRKKPAPDVYELALTRLNMTADRALAFEDSANGLRAALAAGLACIVTPSVYTETDDFTGALRVLPDLSHMETPHEHHRL